MKKQNNLFLTILGIMFLSLGISVACSVSDNKDTNDPTLDDGDILTEDMPVDPIILEEFRNNYAGSYTAEPTAIVPLEGKTMVFNDHMGIHTQIFEGRLSLSIEYNENHGSSEILNFLFFEGIANNNDDNYIHSFVMPVTSTNVILKNSSIITLTEDLGKGSEYSLLINLDNGFLYLNGVKIATKNP